MKDFEQSLLDAHNAHRGRHGAPPVRWNTEMAQQALAWAEKMAREDKLGHASKEERNGHGENIAMSAKQEYSGEEAANQWYSEIQYFDYNNCSQFNPKTGHFTQVVWKGVQEIGSGVATSSTGKHYVCARYNPAGNMKGRFVDNVLPLGGENNKEESKLTSKEENKQNENNEKSSKMNDNKEEGGTVDVEVMKPTRVVEYGKVQHSGKIVGGNSESVFYIDYNYESASTGKIPLYPCETVKIVSEGPPKIIPAYQNINYIDPQKKYLLTHHIY